MQNENNWTINQGVKFFILGANIHNLSGRKWATAQNTIGLMGGNPLKFQEGG